MTDTYADILDTATDIATVSGFHAVSYGAVARSLDIAKTAVVHHFPTAERLRIATARHIINGEARTPGDISIEVVTFGASVAGEDPNDGHDLDRELAKLLGPPPPPDVAYVEAAAYLARTAR